MLPGLGLAIGAGLLKGGAEAYNRYGMSRDLRMTPEQERRMRELERLEARDAFGLSTADRDLYQTRLMAPVQTAEREALARFGASQNIADVGQGAAFRQQQALKQTSEAARAETAQALAARDAEVARQQQEALGMMREREARRKQLEREALTSFLGTTGSALETAGEMQFASKMLDKKLADLDTPDSTLVTGTANMLFGDGPAATPPTNKGGRVDGVDQPREPVYEPQLFRQTGLAFNPLTGQYESVEDTTNQFLNNYFGGSNGF